MQIKEYKWNSNFHMYENVGSVTFTLVTSVGSSMPFVCILFVQKQQLSFHTFLWCLRSATFSFYYSVEGVLLCRCLMMFVFLRVSEVRRWFVHWFEYISSIWKGFCRLELWEDWKSCVFTLKAKKEVGSWRQAFKETHSLSYRYFYHYVDISSFNLCL